MVQLALQRIRDAPAPSLELAVHPAADRQQHIAIVQVIDIRFVANAEQDGEILGPDLGICRNAAELVGFSAAAIAGKEILRRQAKWRAQFILKPGDRILRAFDIKGIWGAARQWFEWKVQLEIRPGPAQV